MPTGTITASTLRIRSAADPAASTIGFVHKGETVDIQDQQGDWLRIIGEAQGQMLRGWASAAYVAVGPAPAPVAVAATDDLPVADDAAHPVTVHDGHAFGPGEVKFAVVYKFGFYTGGVTNWDSAFMSLGLFQWTAGADDDAGELAGLLDALKSDAPPVFQDLFGAYGLDVEVSGGGIIKTGFLTIGGAALDARAKKQQLRSADWAYRFWRAGHHDAVRKCQCELAAKRIAALAALRASGFSPTAWLTSEHGVALLLDEHVNRPGYVVGTLEDALQRAGTPNDPGRMDDAAEGALIAAYVAARNDTKMTDPEDRAARIADAVSKGELSATRGTYTP
jgi:hypothetical protein